MTKAEEIQDALDWLRTVKELKATGEVAGTRAGLAIVDERTHQAYLVLSRAGIPFPATKDE